MVSLQNLEEDWRAAPGNDIIQRRRRLSALFVLLPRNKYTPSVFFHVVSLHSHIKMSGEKMWLDLSEVTTPWLWETRAPWFTTQELYSDSCFRLWWSNTIPAVRKQQAANDLSVPHCTSVLHLESQNDNPRTPNLNVFSTIFTPGNWMILFTIPD